MVKEERLVIRKGKLADFNELFKFLNECPELQVNEEGKTYSKSWVKSCLVDKKMNLVLIAEKGEEIVGFLIAEAWKKKKYSFLSDIFVSKEHRKRGVASKLIREYEKTCRKLGMGWIIGLVLVNNKKMREFIEKNKYKRGHKFYIYEKRLK